MNNVCNISCANLLCVCVCVCACTWLGVSVCVGWVCVRVLPVVTIYRLREGHSIMVRHCKEANRPHEGRAQVSIAIFWCVVVYSGYALAQYFHDIDIQ